MSDAASVPFTEAKAPESAERLHRGALSLIDISASTMANIGQPTVSSSALDSSCSRRAWRHR